MTRLVLLGGGHAHLFVLEALARGAFEGAEVTLVSPVRRQAYSGMVPGLIAGRYRADELSFDLEAIARTSGARYVPLAGRRILPQAGRIELADGGFESYDVLSVATGSGVRGTELPGVAEQALLVKPIDRAGEIVPALARALAADEAPAVVIVGGGAAGIEIALAVRARLRLLAGGDVGTVTLLEGAPGLFGGRLPRAARAAARALARNWVVLRLGAEVASASASGVLLADGTELPARVLVWAAGASATDLLRTSGLALDPQGFVLVDDRLRSPSDGRIFAAGDAATPARWPETPKAGVYAVREGPVLCANLAAACRRAEPPLRYRPQRRFLALLNTGDGRAICSYGSLAASGRWAMTLKDRIDRRFMRRFKRLERGEK
ncbi:MAG: FAD-dependent oxidoreductase [Deltaproteobacteria bacterium]